MRLKRELSYETPEGCFQGTIIAIKLSDNGRSKENLRFTIAVDPLPDDPLHDFRVRVDYWGKNADGLLPDLYRLLGAEVVNLTDDDGDILPEKLSVLEGKRVKFMVQHAPMPGHDIPFRKVVDLRPVNAVVKPQTDQLKRAA